MPAGPSSQTQHPHPLVSVLQRREAQARKLGLTLSAWDPSGECIAGPAVHHEFCRLLDGLSQEAMGRLAQTACLEDCSLVAEAPSGCSMVAVPMRLRRRLIGAAVACFPTFQTAGSERLARACSRLSLDLEHVVCLCRQAIRHDVSEARTLCDVVEWLVHDEQAQEVAGQELATLSSNLADTYEELSLVYRISGCMRVTQSATEFFQTLCKEVVEVMQLEAAAVVLCPREDPTGVKEVVSAGSDALSRQQFGQIVNDDLGARFRTSARAVVENQFTARSAAAGAPESQKVRTLIAVPLLSGQQYLGALLGVNKLAREFDSVDLKLISAIGSQAAVFLANHNLYEDLQDLLMGVLHALTASIDAKDPYTCGHSRRVALISRLLARRSGLGQERAERVYLAGLLHDVGKIGIPEAVLCKPGRLTEAEFGLVQKHPEIGATILGGTRQLEDIVPAILHHHERPDGRGYPHGLRAGSIPVEALIVGLADSFDAMTSSRTYRPAMPLAAAEEEIRRCTGTQFDPRLVELLLSLDLEAFLSELRETADSGGVAFAGRAGE